MNFLAKVNGVPLKQMADEMLRLGIAHYFAGRLSEHNRQAEDQQERGEPVRPTYFVIMLRHWARLKGYEISRFV